MKIFILNIDEVFEFEPMSHEPIVCLSKDKAAKELRSLWRDGKAKASTK